MEGWFEGYRGPGDEAGFSGRIQLSWLGTLEEDDIKEIFQLTRCTASVRKRNGIMCLTVHTNDKQEEFLDEAIELALEKVKTNSMASIRIVHSEPAQGSGRQNVGKQEARSTRQDNAPHREGTEARAR